MHFLSVFYKFGQWLFPCSSQKSLAVKWLPLAIIVKKFWRTVKKTAELRSSSVRASTDFGKDKDLDKDKDKRWDKIWDKIRDKIRDNIRVKIIVF